MIINRLKMSKKLGLIELIKVNSSQFNYRYFGRIHFPYSIAMLLGRRDSKTVNMSRDTIYLLGPIVRQPYIRHYPSFFFKEAPDSLF